MGQAGPGPVDKSEGFGGPGRPRPVDKSEGLGRAGPAQAQPIEVRGFGVTGPGPAGPPSLANPHLLTVEASTAADLRRSLRKENAVSGYMNLAEKL